LNSSVRMGFVQGQMQRIPLGRTGWIELLCRSPTERAAIAAGES
jgi:hypothetical protein